ncbi:MAG TPA: hypothetical protein PLA85_08070 [Micropepsaceae bacterium]|nr:hypothetical protein [Micropepsaceae bacterium]
MDDLQALRMRILLMGVMLTLMGSGAVGFMIHSLASGREAVLSMRRGELRPMAADMTLDFSVDMIRGTDAYFAGLRDGDTVYVAIKNEEGFERPLSVTLDRADADASADFVLRGVVEGFFPERDSDPPVGKLQIYYRVSEVTFDRWPRPPEGVTNGDYKAIIAVLPSGHAVLKAITVNGTVVWENTPW